ncbi:endonuclease/exonuclease/phosphatase family protein [Loktanella salsilacus]|uniref:endonuclease/exonuclease/phosphatase family protein n=1 Tax=Loktanella salsilacus TaxID=195913 RepID=UPI0020B84B41|nr:endonuclease/exonuclease/phosphatase family protein [Loktanella salsilacus]
MLAGQVSAQDIRIATFAAPLGRKGPGLLLRDLGRADDQIDAVAAIVAQVAPDILLLTDVDYDRDGLAMQALADRMGFAHSFALLPNAGRATGLDLDGNGRVGEARDAQGYGLFSGDSGMALLSRWPINADAVQDLSPLLWRDLPWATLPNGQVWTDEIANIQRLSTTGHWIVPVQTPDGPVTAMAFSATPPVFDGPEDRNELRNRDELLLWAHALDGDFGPSPQDYVIAGNANLDPVDGDGRRDAMARMLADPRLTDPLPRSSGGLAAADTDHSGDPALDTADWPDGAPGNLRVSYVLPAATWTVTGSGVFWPPPDDPNAKIAEAAGPHRLVWVDLRR